jgi:hypothetical protein
MATGGKYEYFIPRPAEGSLASISASFISRNLIKIMIDAVAKRRPHSYLVYETRGVCIRRAAKEGLRGVEVADGAFYPGATSSGNRYELKRYNEKHDKVHTDPISLEASDEILSAALVTMGWDKGILEVVKNAHLITFRVCELSLAPRMRKKPRLLINEYTSG